MHDRPREAPLREALLVLALIVAALLIRLPDWRTIPAAGDEVAQARFAIQIIREQRVPLTANDAYTGPFFVDVLAALFLLGVKDPFIGRTVMLIAGTLTIPLTYVWVKEIARSRLAGLVAAAVVAANPAHILLNSHLGGATYLLPLFTTAFLCLATFALRRDRWPLWIAATVMAGLALQANPVGLYVVAGGGLWFLVQSRRLERIGQRWPMWPLLGGLCIALVYAPVIVFNLTSGLGSMSTLDARGYLWQRDPTIFTYLDNLRRLILQLARQTSGVFSGDETLSPLLGLPVLMGVWAIVGFILSRRPLRSLLLLVSVPFVLTAPWFSAHYGLLDPMRFTTFFVPVFAAGMGATAARLAEWLAARLKLPQVVPGLAALALAVAPLPSLYQYNQTVDRNLSSGRVLLSLSEQMVRDNRGEKVYIVYSDAFLYNTTGIPYVPEMHLLLAGIEYEFIPAEQVIGRLYGSHGRPALVLGRDEDAAQLEAVAPLTAWPSPDNALAQRRGYGLYRVDTSALPKPDFVLTGHSAQSIAPQHRIDQPIGDSLMLLGYDLSASPRHSQPLTVTLYWQVATPMPFGTYTQFIHLINPRDNQIAAQVDRQLGRVIYPVDAWQPGEVIVDQVVLDVPAGDAEDHYQLRAGVYLYPSLQRLHVPGGSDDSVSLGEVTASP